MTYADMLSEIAVFGGAGPQGAPDWHQPYDVKVPARTLSDVLTDAGAGRIDFLSLDLQGYEASALSGLDLERWTPSLMLIEIEDEDAQHAVEAVLGSRYETVAWLTPQDVLYRFAGRQLDIPRAASAPKTE